MDNYIIDAFESDDAVIPTAFVIDGIVQSRFGTQLERLVLHGGSQIDPGFVGVPRSAPQLEFDTTQIKAALANMGGIAGHPIDGNGWFYWSLVAAGGLRSATNNGKGAILKGHVFPMRIKATLTSAVITYRVVMISDDGSNAPVSFVYNIAVGAMVSGAVAQAYVLGAVSINNASVDGLTDLEVDFGFDPKVIGGLQYATAFAAAKRNPKITIRSTDISLYEAVGLNGAAQGAIDSVINLDNMTEGSIRGAAPITMTIDEGHIGVDSIEGPDSELLGSEIVITPTWDGTAAWMVLGGIS